MQAYRLWFGFMVEGMDSERQVIRHGVSFRIWQHDLYFWDELPLLEVRH